MALGVEKKSSTRASESARMARVRQRDTTPEVELRRELHSRGLRYRVDRSVPGLDARRRPDIVFGPAKVAVYVDGCFWHCCPVHGSKPKTNQSYWLPKLEANVARDRDTDRRLRELDWEVVRIWEHEEPEIAASGIEKMVKSRLAPE
jgi:DNA mismatch endonuclease (patch repair protein)